ncbi:hypothetical protein F2P79_022983 [Pimephales promelas]|nr:hypothetical protein F2P79_022983 [Pimephales promelas]
MLLQSWLLWNSVLEKIDPKPVADIDFSKPVRQRAIQSREPILPRVVTPVSPSMLFKSLKNEIPDCALFTTITVGSDTDTASEGEQENTDRVDVLTTAEADSKDCHIQKVDFSEEYWAEIRTKLDLFYRQHILTEICTQTDETISDRRDFLFV